MLPFVCYLSLVRYSVDLTLNQTLRFFFFFNAKFLKCSQQLITSKDIAWSWVNSSRTFRCCSFIKIRRFFHLRSLIDQFLYKNQTEVHTFASIVLVWLSFNDLFLAYSLVYNLETYVPTRIFSFLFKIRS